MFDLTNLLGPLDTVVNRVFDLIPDPNKKAQAQLDYQKEKDDVVRAFLVADQAQAQVNAAEAQSPNLFISGARPFILWVCGGAFTWAFVLQPIAVFALTALHKPVTGLPELNMSEMMPVLMGLLGLSGLRTYEKLNNVQGNH